MAILKIFTAIIIALSLGAAAPAQGNAPSPLEDAYIVTLKQGISSRHVESHVNWARAMHDASLGRRALDLPGVEKTYDLGTFHAYSGSFNQDTIRKITDSPELIPLASIAQTNPPWALSTMSSRSPGLEPYRYEETAGKDMLAYVIDSGIHANHAESGRRAALGFNADGPSVVDIFAPGVHVMATDTSSGKATRVLSDTSLAAPHITGLALCLIAAENIKTPAEL
ncbi:subtilisin-like protease [Metarhizium guizhouense ARSEF 977]|uniref:Subtilisin-like protease n=1 Tax=Metarhizium guizhouense (strain ARSEF 977) TaxID=1276136 RepID=A0A0B4GQR6_METGA|nr:subtilisin-like protease [Metarhizium guizhouense ARSEF 977]